MPFVAVNIDEYIERQRQDKPDFKSAWDSSREEYRILGELLELRKQSGLSQSALAKKSGLKQQAISGLENHENSPTLKTICAILDSVGYQIRLVPKA